MSEQSNSTSPRKGPSLSPKTIVGVVIAVLALWFVFINTRKVRIHFWIPWAEAPLWFVLLVTFLAGVAATLLLQRRRR